MPTNPGVFNLFRGLFVAADPRPSRFAPLWETGWVPMRVICEVGMGVPLLVASLWQTGVQGSKQQEGWFEGATPLGFFPRSLPVLVLLPIEFDVINPLAH